MGRSWEDLGGSAQQKRHKKRKLPMSFVALTNFHWRVTLKDIIQHSLLLFLSSRECGSRHGLGSITRQAELLSTIPQPSTIQTIR